MQTLGQWIREDMKKRNMGVREYADFWGVRHPTVAKYMADRYKKPQLEVLTKLSRATHTDIGFLVRLTFPDLTFQSAPNIPNIENRINALPAQLRDSIITQIDALLIQQQQTEHRKKVVRGKGSKGTS